MNGENHRRFRRDLIFSGFLLLAFAAFTVLLRFIDVQTVGFEGSPIGFARLNVAMHEVFPENRVAYLITKWMGYLCLGLAVINTLEFLVDYMRHHLRHMHRRYIIAMAYYAVIVAFFFLFDHVVIINIRPVGPDPSYPSSHTLLAITVLYEQIQLFEYGSLHRNRWMRLIRMLLFVLCAVMVILRFVSGVHWVTDIIGSVLLALALICTNRAFTRFFAPPYSGF